MCYNVLFISCLLSALSYSALIISRLSNQELKRRLMSSTLPTYIVKLNSDMLWWRPRTPSSWGQTTPQTKNTAIRRRLSCHTHIVIFGVHLRHTADYVTPYGVVGCIVGSGGSVKGCIRLHSWAPGLRQSWKKGTRLNSWENCTRIPGEWATCGGGMRPRGQRNL